MEKLTYLKRDTSDREGNALISKQGKPYTRLSIKVESKGDRYISGFGNEGNKDWKVGDEVDITITESTTMDKSGKPYLNFSMPKKDSGNEEVMTMLQKIFMAQGGMANDLRRIIDRLDAKTYPTRESEGLTDDVPFDDQPF